jgi:hypothetical protein
MDPQGNAGHFGRILWFYVRDALLPPHKRVGAKIFRPYMSSK